MECVIDAELFRKISSDTQYNDLKDVLKVKMDNGEFGINDIEECFCFKDFLIAIENKKCKIGIDSNVLELYIQIISKCSNDIKIKFSSLVSRKEHCKIINKGMDSRLKEKLLQKNLKSKIPFIIIANYLNPKLIISTKKDIDDNYSACYGELLEFCIDYKDICYTKQEVMK